MKRSAFCFLLAAVLGSPALAQHLIWQFPSANAAFAPAVGADGTAYLPTADGHLVAVGPDGLQKWQADLQDTPSTGVSLLPDGGLVVGTTMGKVVAVNADGSARWTFTAMAGILNPLAVGADGTVYAASSDNLLHAIGTDGKEKWKFDAMAMITGAPAVGTDGTVFLGTTNTMFYGLNPADGSQKWDFTNIGADPTQAAAAPGGGAAFVSTDGNLFFIDNMGNQLGEANPSHGQRFIPGVVVLPTGAAVVAESDGMLHAVKSDGTDAWAVDLGGAGSRPALGANGLIYVGKQNEVLAIDATGATKLTLPVNGSPTTVTPAASGVVLALIGQSGSFGTTGNAFLVAISPNPPASNAWARSGLVGKNVYQLAIDPASSGTVYAATDSSLWASSDYGNTWTDTNVGGGALTPPVVTKTVDVGAGGTVWAVVNDVLASGKPASWNLTLPLKDYNSIAADPKTAQHAVMARSTDGEFQETTDGGVTSTFPPGPNGVTAVAYSPSGALFALSSGGLQMRDSTGTWKTVESTGAWTSIAFSADGSVVLVGGPDRIALSADGGKTFMVTPAPTLSGTIRAITMDPGNPSVLYAATALPPTGTFDPTMVAGINVYQSMDGGAHWSLFNDGLSTLDVYSLKAVPGAQARILMGTTDGVWAVAATSGGSTPAVLAGDLNGDGRVNVADATLALRFAVGLATPTAAQLAAGDLNHNGKIDVSDATRILRKAVGL